MGRARFCVAVVFFVNGAVFSSWASRVPAIADRVGAGPAAIAVAVFGLSAGAVVGLPLSGVLVSRFGSTAVVRAVLVGYAAALVAVGVAPDLVLLTAALAGLGVGNGMLDVAMNTAAIEVERRYRRQVMAAFHAQFSFGGLAGALVGAGAAGIGAPPAVHLPVVASVLLVAGMAATAGLLPASPDREVGRRGSPRRDRRLVLLGLLVLCSLLCEGAVYDWSAVYLRDEVGGSPAVAALGFAAFSLSMACCRLVADRFVDRVGRVRYVRVAGVLAAAGLGLVLLGPGVAAGVVGFGLVGLALAGVVPTLFSAAADGRVNPAGAIAVVSTIGYSGFLAGPALIGGIAAASSLRLAVAALVVLALAVSAGAGVLRDRPGRAAG
ncbi:putative MFS family arabinose efflux permease [Saccharothrix saharensis]|uniref:Putative MFS family arabinose efflux permease n=1 Tax=Saccharothrix saharensis TaxID=571190 RepID=A0A543JR25_9PSEU|nr:MFS transporter [Saccharothrix saharensis]TQM85205.1 putative MFS family arabinose efflux permease [Saccharothrix saharensis]